jgi:hypothetical protein
MRIILIIGALLMGLVGLLMSVCGGTLLVQLISQGFGALFDGHNGSGQQLGIGVLLFIVLPAGCLVGGGMLCWASFSYIRARARRD